MGKLETRIEIGLAWPSKTEVLEAKEQVGTTNISETKTDLWVKHNQFKNVERYDCQLSDQERTGLSNVSTDGFWVVLAFTLSRAYFVVATILAKAVAIFQVSPLERHAGLEPANRTCEAWCSTIWLKRWLLRLILQSVLQPPQHPLRAGRGLELGVETSWVWIWWAKLASRQRGVKATTKFN